MSNVKNQMSNRMLSLKIGEEISFPIEQMQTVRTTASNLKARHSRTGVRFRTSIDTQNFVINVTREN